MNHKRMPLAASDTGAHNSESKVVPAAFHHALAGFTAGIVSTAALHPLDSIKVRFQAREDATGLFAKNASYYRTSFSALKHFRSSIYNGLVPALTASAVSWGMFFFLYDIVKVSIFPNNNFAASGLAGCATVCVTNPMWLIKTRMQLSSEQSRLSTFRAIGDIYRTEGITGFYRGIGPALLLTSNGAVQVATYERLKKYFDRNKSRGKFYEYMVMGGLSKVVATTVTYPLQVIKTRMQQQQSQFVDGRYSSFYTAARFVLKHEGVHGFYKGLGPGIARVAPHSAVTFAVYEEVLRLSGHTFQEY